VIYFTADTHFGHKNIINFCRRPFADINEMREKMINSINARVGEKDELWHLGDFGLHLRTDDCKELLKRIVCKHTRLILGNHDENQHGQCFEQYYQAHILKFNHQSFYLSHYPLRSWRQNFQLHGHEHGTMKAMVGQLDVGVDNHCASYTVPFGTPWSLEEVVEYVQRRDRDALKDACKQKHGDRIIVGGYGGRNKLDQPNFAELSQDDRKLIRGRGDGELTE
jgi:calcineurin-like phosphoesterase family protein